MPISVTCPACKVSFSAADAAAGGTIPCPRCGARAAVAGSPLARRPASPARSASASARPQLLDRLPPSLAASPAFIAGGAALVLVYGAVLLVALSRSRASRVEEPYTLVEVAPPPPVVAPPEPAAPAPSPADSAPVSPAPTPAPAPPPPPVVAKAEPPKAEPKPAPPPAPKPKPIRTLAHLGPLVDPAGDCRLIRESGGLTIALPGKLHILSPELNKKNAPMALTDVEGDFIAQVKVADEVMPGRTPVEKMSFAFHGAGLLLWKDKDNYVRLERAGMGASGRPHLHQILVEVCKDGKPAGHAYEDFPAGPTYLRLERRNDAVVCSYGGDGQKWKEALAMEGLFPGKVRIGISASNTSKKAFPARFEEFTLAERSP